MKAYCIEAARKALLNFVEWDGGPLYTYETDIIDLITDLLHLAEAEGADPRFVARAALGHWEAERDELCH